MRTIIFFIDQDAIIFKYKNHFMMSAKVNFGHVTKIWSCLLKPYGRQFQKLANATVETCERNFETIVWEKFCKVILNWWRRCWCWTTYYISIELDLSNNPLKFWDGHAITITLFHRIATSVLFMTATSRPARIHMKVVKEAT